MLNALTIDVEDYYHVSAFESIIKFEDWGRFGRKEYTEDIRAVKYLQDKGYLLYIRLDCREVASNGKRDTKRRARDCMPWL